MQSGKSYTYPLLPNPANPVLIPSSKGINEGENPEEVEESESTAQ